MTKILITGGAGFIGSHVALGFLESGYQVRILDNLSTGSVSRIKDLDVEFFLSDIQDEAIVEKASKDIDGLIHLAASKSVGESVKMPGKYLKNNYFATCRLLEVIDKTNLQAVIFSSSAAVYAPKNTGSLMEEDRCDPPSPYGLSKLICEKAIEYIFNTLNIASVALRYFNVIGARDNKRADNSDFNLIPNTLSRIQKRKPAQIHGNDFDTVDGTCVRDYVDVRDIARAHVMSFEKFRNGNQFEVLNLGSKHGYSVMQVLSELFGKLGMEKTFDIGPRRPGDPAYLVADYAKALRILGWKPEYDLVQMISSAIEASGVGKSK